MVKLEDMESMWGIAAAFTAVVAVSTFLWMRSTPPKNNENQEESWDDHVQDHKGLREVYKNLFVLEAPGCSMGPPTRNMTIYRVPDKSRRLVIFNGIAVNKETVAEIEKLGTPSVLVVPNCCHRCCAAVWKARYPEMMVVAPESALTKTKEVVQVDMSTQEWSKMDGWSKWIHTHEIDGWKRFETILEVELDVSGTGKKALLVADLLFTMEHVGDAGMINMLLDWLFDSSITIPNDGSIIVPKVARISRVFAIQDWSKAELWYRNFAKEHGSTIAVMVVGHGVPVIEVDKSEGCRKALEGVADQLVKPRW